MVLLPNSHGHRQHHMIIQYIKGKDRYTQKLTLHLPPKVSTRSTEEG